MYVGMVVPIGTETYSVNGPDEAWSAVVADTSVTFTLNPGEQWSGELHGAERTELADQRVLPFGTEVWWSMAVRVCAPVDAPWTVLGQIRQTDDAGDYATRSPILGNYLYADGSMQIVTRSDPTDPSTGNPVGVTRYTDPAFAYGVWTRLVYRFTLSRTGTGALQVWRDGTEIVPASSIPLGYNDAVGPCLRFGVYRNPAGTVTTVADYANVEIGTADLSDRITNPLPLPS